MIRLNSLKKLCEQSKTISTIEQLFSPLIIDVLERSSYAICTKKNFLQLLMHLQPHVAPEFPLLSETSAFKLKQDQWLADYINTPKPTITLQEIEEALDKSMMTRISLENVLMRLFLEVPVRDDLQLVFSEHSANTDHNSLYYDKTKKRWCVHICTSKNVGIHKKLGPQTYTLSSKLSNLVRDYMILHGFPEYPFGKEKHTCLVGRILKKLGLKNDKRSINLIRIAAANSAKESNDPCQVAEMAQKCLHSVSIAKTLYES